MPTLDKPTDPIETYLSEAGRELRRRLPAWMVDQRLAEAREHLTERAKELITEGMAPAQAQATAVSAFGPAKEWVKSIAEAAYADSGAIKVRRVAIGTGIVVMAATFFSLWGEGVIIYHVCWSMFWLGLLMIAASAFRSRRSATPMLLAAAFIGAVALFLWAGATTIDGMSANMSKRKP